MVAEHDRGFGRGMRVDRDGLESRSILNITTAGTALFQEQVDTVIRRCTTRVNGAVATLSFQSGSGDAWHLTRQSPGTRAAFVSDTTIDCDDTDCANDTYTKTSFDYVFLEGCATMSRHVIARGRSYTDILAVEMTAMVIGLMDVLEDATFQGNFGGAAPLEFDGLFELLNAAAATQVLVPSDAVPDAVPANSVVGTLTLKLLDQLLDDIMTGPHAIFVSKAGRRLIRALLQAQQEFVNVTRVRAGFEVEAYFDAPIVVTDAIPNDLAWGIVAATNQITALSGATGTAASTAIVAVNLDEVFYGELTPLTVEPLAKCSSRKQRTDAYWDGTLVLACSEGAAMIIGVDPDC